MATETAKKPETRAGEESGNLAVDDNAREIIEAFNDEVDSSYGSDANSVRTASITSSIYDYRYENGRRYHAYREGQYVLPNDDSEQDRLDLHHHLWRLLLHGALYAAPLKAPSRILDLGTGTGIWAIDIADEFPSATVAGIDLSPIQPDWVPPNCQFYVDDYDQSPWTFRHDEDFDYIHCRALCGTTADWPRFYAEALSHLTPGGYLEMQEYDAWTMSDDDSLDRAPWVVQWCEKLDEASIKFGKRLNIAQYHKQWMIRRRFRRCEGGGD